MQQQTVFPVLSVQTTDQQRIARDLAVIVNVLGYKVIEIEQRNPLIRQLEGIMVCKYREMAQSDEEMLGMTGGRTEDQRYPHEIIGGSLVFVQNPYARRALGTGRVAFLIDDDRPVPVGAMSGEKTGWNREFLASHFADPVACNYWTIVDDGVRAEIAARAEVIKANSKKAGRPIPSKAPVVDSEVVTRLSGDAQAEVPADPVVGDDVSSEPPQVVLTVEQRMAAMAEKFDTALQEISTLKAENAAMREENEKLRKTAVPHKRGPKPAMAGGFAGRK